MKEFFKSVKGWRIALCVLLLAVAIIFAVAEMWSVFGFVVVFVLGSFTDDVLSLIAKKIQKK